MKSIDIRGARTHNLKNLDLDLPRDKLIVFTGLSDQVTVGRYHSLRADAEHLPRELRVSARSDDGVVMAIEHDSEPVAAVQFHPESIMSLGGEAGMRIIENVVALLARKSQRGAA